MSQTVVAIASQMLATGPVMVNLRPQDFMSFKESPPNPKGIIMVMTSFAQMNFQGRGPQGHCKSEIKRESYFVQ